MTEGNEIHRVAVAVAMCCVSMLLRRHSLRSTSRQWADKRNGQNVVIKIESKKYLQDPGTVQEAIDLGPGNVPRLFKVVFQGRALGLVELVRDNGVDGHDRSLEAFLALARDFPEDGLVNLLLGPLETEGLRVGCAQQLRGVHSVARCVYVCSGYVQGTSRGYYKIHTSTERDRV